MMRTTKKKAISPCAPQLLMKSNILGIKSLNFHAKPNKDAIKIRAI